MHVVAETFLALLVPGWTMMARRRWLAIALLIAGVAVPIGFAGYTLIGHRSWVALSLDATFLGLAAVVLVLALVSRVVAILERWWAHRDDEADRRELLAVPLALALCLPLGLGVGQLVAARNDLQPIFTPTDEDQPLFDALDAVTTVPPASEGTVTTVPTTQASTTVSTEAPIADSETIVEQEAKKPARPRSGVDPTLLANTSTVLLLGGDAGPDRSGLRTDTMMLFTLDRVSGRASLVSIMRDMDGFLFPPGSELERRYPYGWDKLANAVYPIVSNDESLRAAYEVEGIRPGVVALAQAVGYSLDVTIDDYVLVDMQGFLELIDALGGVTVDVPKAVPMPGNVPGALTQYPDTIGPGVVRMDGTTALGYVRSRKGDSDYQRTARQRGLLQALATQLDLQSVALSFPRIAEAIGGTLRTSLSPDELAETLAVIGGETAIVESVGLAPPLVDVKHPDFQQMAEIVGKVRLAVATGEPSGY